MNEDDENAHNSKRSKSDDHAEKHLQGRLMALQDENKQLKDKIGEMETTWMRKCTYMMK